MEMVEKKDGGVKDEVRVIFVGRVAIKRGVKSFCKLLVATNGVVT